MVLLCTWVVMYMGCYMYCKTLIQAVITQAAITQAVITQAAITQAAITQAAVA